MRPRTYWALGLMGLITSIAATAGEESTYLCLPDLSTGFRFVSGEWRSVDFKTDHKYIVRPAKGNELKSARWVVVEVGQDFPLAKCQGFNEYGWLDDCRGWEEFRFNRNTLKYLSAYLIGYVNADKGKENENTPSLQIGKCSRI